MDYCTVIKEAISPKTLNKFRYALVICWILLGAIICGAFLKIENTDDFRCDGKGDIDKDFIRGKCRGEYRIKNHKLRIPPYAFMLLNFSLIAIVTVIYSECMKSTVNELKSSHEGAEGVPRNRRQTLFMAYLCQLVVGIFLQITFIVLLETHLLYPKNFPSDFLCSIKNLSFNGTFNCFNQGAGNENVWIKALAPVNRIFAFFAFLEIIWILTRARKEREFMENWRFYADHLRSNSGERRRIHPEAQAQNDFQSAIQTIKENVMLGTKQPSDFKQPFRRPNPGEGKNHDFTIDEIYVNVAIIKDRANHSFAKDLDRSEQLKKYPPDAKDCNFAKPEDILDETHKNVLVVGRPGIGKTSLSTKMLRLWTFGEAFNGDEHYKADFTVVFLVKFRRFNDNANLTLRELLASAETVQRLDDSIWEFVQNESTKVLLIFDGLDEYSRKQEINTQEDYYKNDVEEKMPVSVLYKKLTKGNLLRGASILTTTRPTAVKYVAHINFERTVEICGFTSENVEEYVEKFTRGVPEAKEKILGHIKSNINLFSLCYIPINCFLICHCLLQIFLPESSQALPTKMTDIYKMTVKMLLFNHNREGFSHEELEKLKPTHMYAPFEEFPKQFQNIFRRLGKIAFKGIKENRLLFEASEVRGLEDCGLLHKLPDLKQSRALSDPPKSQFCFTHLTVQEFFAAKHLVDTKSNEGIEKFVRKYINDGTWEVVLQFVAGLLKSSQSSDIFIKLLPESTEKRKSSEPKTLTSWPATKEDQHLAVQVCKCLYEINDEQQQPVLQNKIDKIKFNAADLNRCWLAPIDVAAVLHFLENAEEVLQINLSHNGLGDLSASQVKKFIVDRERKQWSRIRHNLTDNAAKESFAAALMHNNCKLKSLDLSYNNFADNAAKDFAAALEHSNCKLESLDLSWNKFTDNAAKDFAAALQHSNCKLKSLNLSFNKFTDNAAKDFAAALMHSNCKLKCIQVYSNNFTRRGRKYLTDLAKLSNCKVLYGLSMKELSM